MRIKPGLLLPPPPVPDYVAGAEYLFTYNGNRYSYIARRSYLESLSGPNNIILRLVFGINYGEEMSKIYGYSHLGGDWPEWSSSDSFAGQKVFDALVERGVKITPK